MGNNKSKLTIISYEDAEKRISNKELNRLKRAFNQYSSKGFLSWDKFHSEVFRWFLPISISELLFKSFKASGNSMIVGLTFKELLVFLVLLTAGTFEEKCKLIYQIYCNESETGVDYSTLQFSSDKPVYFNEIRTAREFTNDNCVLDLDGFMKWIKLHPRFNQLSEWILCGEQLQLTDYCSEPTDLYGLVAGVTHLNEQEVMNLEKTYRRLLRSSDSKLDEDKLSKLISPPFPKYLVPYLFKVFDENQDDHIDFKELACGISACCRGPIIERKKFCCRVFSKYSEKLHKRHFDLNDVKFIYESCLEINNSVKIDENWLKDCSVKFKSLVETYNMEQDHTISFDDFLIWLNENCFIDPFLNIINEIFTVVFCLKPETPIEELLLLSNWIYREEQYLESFQHIYLISKQWLEDWVYILQAPPRSMPILHPSSTPGNNTSTSANTSASSSAIVAAASTKGLVQHSKSMNNLFAGRKHHYELPNRSSSSKLKSITSEIDCNEHITGRYIRHSSIRPSQHDKVLPQLMNITSFINGFKMPYVSQSIESIKDNNNSSNGLNTNGPQVEPHVALTSIIPPINNSVLILSNIPKILQNVPVLNPVEEDDISITNDDSINVILDRSVVCLRHNFYLLSPSVWQCLLTWYGGGPAISRPFYVDCPESNFNIKPLDTNQPINCIYFPRCSGISMKLELHLLTLVLYKYAPTTTSNIATTINNNISNMIGSQSSSLASSFSSAFINSANYLSVSSLMQPSIGQQSATNTSYPQQRLVKYRISVSHEMSQTQFINEIAARLKLCADELRLWRITSSSSNSSGNIDESVTIAALQSHNNLVLMDEDDQLLAYQLQCYDRILVEQRNPDLTWPEELSQMAKNKTLHNKKASVNKGVTGLSNLGNTCFFNSAIQCISNTTPLTQYFIQDLYHNEINRSNIHGCNGMLAVKYAELIKDIWKGSSTLIVPVKLKIILERYAKQFSVHQQHDAQELLSALLDALHEDLNRIHEKPSYKELKDSDGRPDEEVAHEAWQAHIDTHQSIIVDLFHGLLKSKVVCDICQSTSVRFDAFSILSLPIPIDSKEEFEINVFAFPDQLNTPRKLVVYLPTNEMTVSNIQLELSSQLELTTNKHSISIAQIECYHQNAPTNKNNFRIAKFLDNSELIQKSKKYFAYIDEIQLSNEQDPRYVNFVFYNRNLTQRSNYFLVESRREVELFDYPQVIRINVTNQLNQITNWTIYRLLIDKLNRCHIPIGQSNFLHETNSEKFQPSESTNGDVSLSQSNKINRAVDCDHLDQHKPFILRQVDSSGCKCKCCHWSKFCYGCDVPFNNSQYKDHACLDQIHYFAIDWSLAYLHFKYNSNGQTNDISGSATEINQKDSSTNRPSKELSVIDCLEHFISTETLDKDTPYQCSSCKSPQPAHKKLDLWVLPHILIIHLKRFHFNNNGWQKSNRYIKFPSRNLDLSGFLQDPNQLSIRDISQEITNNYSLFAVNCHLGSIQMGHYVTYAKNKIVDKWFLFNDSICKEVSESDVLKSNAYILFYERKDLDIDKFIQHTSQAVNSTNDDSSTTTASTASTTTASTTTASTTTASTTTASSSLVLQADEILSSDDVDNDMVKKYCILQ